jgi:hypothetical protein
MQPFVRPLASLPRVAVLLLGLVGGGCQDRTFAVRIRGHTLAHVVEELGPPYTMTAFPASLSLYEYQLGLRHHLSRAELTAHVVVKQGRWSGLLRTRYVWFVQRKQQWVAVDALDWPRGTMY